MEFIDLKAQYKVLKGKIDANIEKVLTDGNFIMGEEVKELEAKLAEYVGVKYCATCANGTDALQIALMCYDVKPGDVIFVPSFTFFSTAEVVSALGATPIFIDSDERTFNMDPDKLEKAIGEAKAKKMNIRGVIAVDLFGQPANYPRIREIVKKYDLFLIEDGAQGFGGSIDGKKACSFGDISTTSFFPAKPLGCYGDGGAIFTDDDAIDARLRSLRAGGKSPVDKYDNIEIGTNSRLDTMQAAILLPKFHAFRDYEVDNVNKVANWYNKYLGDKVVTPTILEGYLSSWAQYTILLRNKEERDSLQLKLKENGIPSMIYYPRGMHQQQAFKSLQLDENDYPNTIEATKRVLSLPMHPYMEEEDVKYICSVILKEIK